MALDFKQVDADLVPFRRRLLFVFFLVIVLFCVLIGRFAWLQIINKNAYTERAEKNRTVTVVSQAARGLIYDRNGELLAKNTLAYSLEITPDKVSDLEKAIAAHSENIPIPRRFRLPKCERADRPCSLTSDSGKRTYFLIIRRKYTMIIHHDLPCGFLHIPHSIIIT